jgi:hypothetical protein
MTDSDPSKLFSPIRLVPYDLPNRGVLDDSPSATH